MFYLRFCPTKEFTVLQSTLNQINIFTTNLNIFFQYVPCATKTCAKMKNHGKSHCLKGSIDNKNPFFQKAAKSNTTTELYDLFNRTHFLFS